MIDLTPLEVRKKKGDFRRIMRGYDPATVDDFIDLVADRLEELVRENMSLSERLSKLTEQVGEYRERERALTDALVSAQEMRQEVHRQTTRDAELVKQATEQETSQLRRTVEEETSRLRSSAEQEAAQVREAAQREAEAVRQAARHESEQILAGLHRERERSEQAMERVRAMRRQLVDSYRSLLAREVAELEDIARSVDDVDAAPTQASTEPPTAAEATAGYESFASFEDNAFEEGLIEDDGIRNDVFEGGAFDAEPFAPEPFLPDDGTVVPPEGDPLAASAFGGEPESADMLDAGTEDEALAAEAIDSLGDIIGSLGLSAPTSKDEAPTDVDAGAEMELYDSLSPQNPDDSVPGPIGLTGISLLEEGAEIDLTRQHVPRPTGDGVQDGFSHERGVVPVTPPPEAAPPPTVEIEDDVDDIFELADIADEQQAEADTDDEFEDVDDDTARLLRNAAAAGYTLPDDDELLLSEAVGDGGDEDDDDDPWLPTLLEEEDR